MLISYKRVLEITMNMRNKFLKQIIFLKGKELDLSSVLNFLNMLIVKLA